MSDNAVFTLDVTDHASILRCSDEFNASASQLRRAVMRSLNKTARWLQSQSAKAISHEKRIPQKIVRHRLSVLNAKLSQERLKAFVVAKLTGVRAADLGRLLQTATGAKAGRQLFKGDFVARMPKGHRGVYQRKTNRALPIQEVRVSLEPFASRLILDLLEKEASHQFDRLFAHEIEYATRLEART